MNNKREKIFFSIIICCYNSEKYIAETLDSIINQSYKNWEIIIIDDRCLQKPKFDHPKSICDLVIL